MGSGPSFVHGGPGSVVRFSQPLLLVQRRRTRRITSHGDTNDLVVAARFFNNRVHAIDDHPGARRIGSPVSRQRRFLYLFCPLHRSCLVCSSYFVYKFPLTNCNRGFAIGWDYAISWLIILPFELIAAGLTINFWRSDINIGVWITVFLVILSTIQIFGVRGYGEGESFEPGFQIPFHRFGYPS